jgi:hypothetical protein
MPPVNIRQIAQLHDSLRAWLFVLPEERHGLVFDVDSVVLVVYGHAEGARVGYNPKKPGRRSYHPLFCFESTFEEFWHGIWRRGDAASSTGIIPFLKVCLAKVPAAVKCNRLRFRMDSGFFGKRVVEFLDQAHCGYVIVAKEYKKIASSAESVGRIWFGKSAEIVIKGQFHRFIRAESVRASGHHSNFVVQALDRATGNLAFGFEPVEQQWLVLA